MTISRDPKTGLIVLGQTVSLTCNSPSQPTGGLLFIWRTRVEDFILSDVGSMSANFLLQIPEDSPPIVRAFCYVFADENLSLIGVGKLDIEITGIQIIIYILISTSSFVSQAFQPCWSYVLY